MAISAQHLDSSGHNQRKKVMGKRGIILDPIHIHTTIGIYTTNPNKVKAKITNPKQSWKIH